MHADDGMGDLSTLTTLNLTAATWYFQIGRSAGCSPDRETNPNRIHGAARSSRSSAATSYIPALHPRRCGRLINASIPSASIAPPVFPVPAPPAFDFFNPAPNNARPSRAQYGGQHHAVRFRHCQHAYRSMTEVFNTATDRRAGHRSRAMASTWAPGIGDKIAPMAAPSPMALECHSRLRQMAYRYSRRASTPSTDNTSGHIRCA